MERMAAGYTATTIIADEQFVERKRLFEDFLSSDRVYGERDYKEKIRTMLRTHERRLVVNLNDLRQANARFSRRFRSVERAVRERGLDMMTLTIDELEALWQEVKG